MVLYHATGSWHTTAFTAMPLMFFIAGSLFARSVDGRPARAVIGSRFRRILYPYWLYVAAMIVLWAALGVLGEVEPLQWIAFAMPVLSLGGPVGPGEGTTLELTWIALWYLQMHLILSLAGGWMRRMQLTHGRRYWIVLVGVTVLLAPVGVGGLTFWALCWSLGYLQQDGSLGDWMRRNWRTVTVLTGPPGFALFFAFHESNIGIAGGGGLLLGVFWLTLALGLRDRLEPLLEGHRWRAFLHWSSARSLTIYLWHMPIIYGLVELAMPTPALGLGRFVVTCALLVPVCMVVGWAEDISARRPPTLWPRLAIDLRSGSAADTARGPEETEQRDRSADRERRSR